MKQEIQFNILEKSGARPIKAQLSRVIIAGWTGRNKSTMEAHISELEELGIDRPVRTPMFYRVSTGRVTTGSEIEVIGDASSGEVEYFLINVEGEIYIGIGSDHTDREAETQGVTLSKQMCDKPVGSDLWRLTDVKDHWSELVLRSTILDEEGQKIVYQEGSVETMLSPEDLMSKFSAENPQGGFGEGDFMMCGTLPAIGGVRGSSSFEFELVDPIMNRKLVHSYRITELPMVG